MLRARTICSWFRRVVPAEAGMHIVSVLLVIWLIIGAIAAGTTVPVRYMASSFLPFAGNGAWATALNRAW